MSKELLLFVPGWGIPVSGYREICAGFEDRFEVILVNWSGLKNSREIPARIQEAILKLNQSVFALGHSLGALALLDVARLNLGAIRKVGLLSGTSCFTKKEDGYSYGWDHRILRRMKARIKSGPGQVLKTFYQSLFTGEEIKKGLLEKFENAVLKEINELDPDGLINGLDYLEETDVRDYLKDIQIPALLIHGEMDTIIPAGASDLIHENLSVHKEYFKAAGAGHMPFLSGNGEFIRKVSDFFLLEEK